MTKVWGYRKHSAKTGEILDMLTLDGLPPLEFETVGFWIDLDPALAMGRSDILGAVHGANHALLHALPLFVSAERTDIGTECPSMFQARARPLRLIVYDAHPGGIGVTRRSYPKLRQIVKEALRIVKTCKCGKDGCPSCVWDCKCQEYNDCVSKAGAVRILSSVLAI